MREVLLDTDAFSEILKGKNEVVVARGAAYLKAFGRFTTSAITVLEVIKGFQKVLRPESIQIFIKGLDAVNVLPLDTNAALIAGRIYGDLERTGQPIGRADPMIAGIAISRGLPLVTGNFNHYNRVVDLGYELLLENWHKAPPP